MTEQFALTDEKLDELFVKQVGSVTQIVERLPRNSVIMSTCARWFKIFQHATPEEKFARNCMLLLLHKQLNDQNTLSYPFTDARSCHRDLRTLHQMSIALHHTRESVDDDDDCNSFCSMEYSSPISIHSSGISCREDVLQRLANANKLLAEQNATMSGELQVLQLEKESLLQRRQSFHAKAETLRNQNNMYGKEIGYMKHIFACSALTALKLFVEPTFAQPIHYFVTLFSVLCEDQHDRAHFEQLDKQLGRILHAHMDYYTRLSIQYQVGRAYDEMRAKVSKRYKKVLQMQEATRIEELSLVAMRDLMMLRKLFLDSYKGDKHAERAVLKFLQERHDELAEGL
ncbi:uncharacterized protein [Drosophila virilis]|uniref:Uncharacterized protein n=1 Tax=Drosophila virilis TaxID=7244 RepID=B4M3V5_DROVI|nr:uncharacterized protein LOC6632374 [Drosophila virilis]EDW59316.1 uncharacterized protein Dvir_GJ10806 [Drosophila virilis]